jgi:hypothetical protein
MAHDDRPFSLKSYGVGDTLAWDSAKALKWWTGLHATRWRFVADVPSVLKLYM